MAVLTKARSVDADGVQHRQQDVTDLGPLREVQVAAAAHEAAAFAGKQHGQILVAVRVAVLDLTGEEAIVGKTLRTDLTNGKMTLPLIRAISVGTPEDAALIRAAITGGRLTEFAPVMDVLARTGSLDYALSCAIRESESAAACVAGLPLSPHRESLLELSAFAARRTY